MIVKKTKQLGSFKKGINLYVPKKRIVSAAPSGIVVATTNTINVVDTFNLGQTVSLTKNTSTEYRSLAYSTFLGTEYCNEYGTDPDVNLYAIYIKKEGNDWIYRYEGVYSCDGNFSVYYTKSSVLEVSSGIIPTTGWSPSLTITAA